MRSDAVGAYAIRDYAAADSLFVFDAWVKSYWDAINRDPWPVTFASGKAIGVLQARLNRDHCFTPGQREYAAFCIASHGCVVAYLKSDPDELMGFACGGSGILHYVYVKSAFRKLGIGLAMTRAVVGSEGPVKVSHLTDKVDRLLRDREWTHEPNWEKVKK